MKRIKIWVFFTIPSSPQISSIWLVSLLCKFDCLCSVPCFVDGKHHTLGHFKAGHGHGHFLWLCRKQQRNAGIQRHCSQKNEQACTQGKVKMVNVILLLLFKIYQKDLSKEVLLSERKSLPNNTKNFFTISSSR